jgi:20S proteasome subunit alpha 7
VLGVVCKDGVVIACEKLVQSKLYAKGSNRRVLAVDRGLGAGFAGVYPDAK